MAFSALVVLSGLHFFQLALVKPLVPAFRSIIVSLDDRFIITDARTTQEGANEIVRFRANLGRPLVLGNQILYPFGTHGTPQGGFQVTNTVGDVLQLPALLLIIALAWPARRASELVMRLGVALSIMATLLLFDTPFTAVAELRNGLATAIDPRAVDGWMIASRFLMGGGGYALILLLAAGSIAFSRWCLEGRARSPLRPRWQTVTFREFDAFFRAYPRPLEVDPPFDHPGRHRTLRDPTLGSGSQSRVAECQMGRTRSRYRIRADLSVVR